MPPPAYYETQYLVTQNPSKIWSAFSEKLDWNAQSELGHNNYA
jgi:hypothetical protein